MDNRGKCAWNCELVSWDGHGKVAVNIDSGSLHYTVFTCRCSSPLNSPSFYQYSSHSTSATMFDGVESNMTGEGCGESGSITAEGVGVFVQDPPLG